VVIITDADEMSNSDELSAKAALLDFYGNRAVSFASLFIASIFGLVTMVALFQAIGASGFSSGEPIRWSLNFMALLVSGLAYVAFSYAAYYTFSMFSNYASVADVLVRESLHQAAKSENLTFPLRATGKDLELLAHTLKSSSLELKSAGTKEKDEYTIDFRTYCGYISRKRNRFLLKKHERLFKYGFALLLLGLAFLGYYPILRALLG
jgi:hypothetical protein